MTDRELLELAAKAAGYRLWGGSSGPWSPHEKGLLLADAVTMWRPQEDDGQALRLAVKLNIALNFMDSGGIPCADVPGTTSLHAELVGKRSKEAATRRAIVRAAAEIGRKTPTLSEASQ